MAVSADSMMASAPSKIAVATSVTSARVGRTCVHHRLQHLGRHDHRHLRAARLADDVLLDHGHLLERHLDPEVAARHHHRVHQRQDAGQVGDDLRALELGDDRQVGALARARNFRTSWMSAAERTNETATIVHAVRDAEAQVVAVLRR